MNQKLVKAKFVEITNLLLLDRALSLSKDIYFKHEKFDPWTYIDHEDLHKINIQKLCTIFLAYDENS